MDKFLRSAIAGAAGAVTLTALHQILKNTTRHAPRLDLLGEEALEKATGQRSYWAALAGDLVSNTAYYALVAAGKRNAVPRGAMLGLAAGLGSVLLPGRIGLSGRATARSLQTQAMTVALYTTGALVAGAVARSLEE